MAKASDTYAMVTLSLDAVMAASIAIEPDLGHALPSRYVQATRATTARAS